LNAISLFLTHYCFSHRFLVSITGSPEGASLNYDLNRGLVGRVLNRGLVGRVLNRGLVGRVLNRGLVGRVLNRGLVGRVLNRGLVGRVLNKVSLVGFLIRSRW